jgi:hypothetical protein
MNKIIEERIEKERNREIESMMDQSNAAMSNEEY